MMITDQHSTLASTDHVNISGLASPELTAGSKKTRAKAAATKAKRKGNAAQRITSKPKAVITSKQDKVLSLLRRTEGAAIAVIMKATGWQRHSVHGFLAGVVRKKLGLNLKSAELDGRRIYRIVAGKPTKSATAKRKGSR